MNQEDEVQQRTEAGIGEAADALSLAPKPAEPARERVAPMTDERRTMVGASAGLKMCPMCGHSRAFCACPKGLPTSGTAADLEWYLTPKRTTPDGARRPQFVMPIMKPSAAPTVARQTKRSKTKKKKEK